MRDERRRFLETFLREIAHKDCFGGQYLSNLCAIQTETEKRNELRFRFRVPLSMCLGRLSEGDSDPSMSASALLSLCDDLSTVALVAVDRSLRPGVSISLHTELLQPIPAESEIVVVAKADKIGKILGFSSIDIWDESNEEPPRLMARVRHIKYLPMGLLWDSLLGVGLFVFLFLWLYDWWYGKSRRSEIDHLLRPQRDREQPSETAEPSVGALFNSLDVQRVAVQDVPARLMSQPLSDHTSFFHTHVRRFMCNGVGSCHGGAVAVMIEEACVAARRSELVDKQMNSAAKIVSMDIRYLAAMKGELLIRVDEDVHAGVLSTVGEDGETKRVYRQTVGVVMSKKKLFVCAEFSCVWALENSSAAE